MNTYLVVLNTEIEVEESDVDYYEFCLTASNIQDYLYTCEAENEDDAYDILFEKTGFNRKGVRIVFSLININDLSKIN